MDKHWQMAVKLVAGQPASLRPRKPQYTENEHDHDDEDDSKFRNLGLKEEAKRDASLTLFLHEEFGRQIQHSVICGAFRVFFL